MRILFVTPPPYLPNRLHRNRSFDLIRILARKHEVYLLSVTIQKEEPKEFKEIKRVCKSVKIVCLNPLKVILNCLRFPFLPYEVAYCYSEKAREEIQKIIKREEIDLVYLKRLRSAVLLPVIPTGMEGHISTDVGLRKIPRQARNDKVGIVLDSTDAMSMFYFRMFKNQSFPKNFFYLWQGVLYKRFEKKIMRKIKNWIVCSPIDHKYLREFGKEVNVHVVPNPVDTNYFSPLSFSRPPRGSPFGHPRGEYPNGNSLLFRGLMDKPVNIDACLFFVKEIMPLIKQSVKDVKLFIVGPKPHKTIQKLHNGKDVFVTGFVKDMREYLKATTISICPVRIASGTRFKILQSWAFARPVVSTSKGAEGLFYKKNQNILIADDPKEFAQKTVSLLRNRKLYDTLARSGRKTAVKYYSFEAINDRVEQIIQEITLHKRHSGDSDLIGDSSISLHA